MGFKRTYSVPVMVEIDTGLGYPMIFVSGIKLSNSDKTILEDRMFLIATCLISERLFGISMLNVQKARSILYDGMIPEECQNKKALKAAIAEYQMIVHKLKKEGALCAQNYALSQTIGSGPRYLTGITRSVKSLSTLISSWYKFAVSFVQQQAKIDLELKEAAEKHQICIHLVRQDRDNNQVWVDDLFMIIPSAVYNSCPKEDWSNPEFVKDYILRIAGQWLSTPKGWESNCSTCKDYNWGDLVMDLPLKECGMTLDLVEDKNVSIDHSCVDLAVDQYEHIAPTGVQAKVFLPGDDNSYGTADIDFRDGVVTKLTLHKGLIPDGVDTITLKVRDGHFTAMYGVTDPLQIDSERYQSIRGFFHNHCLNERERDMSVWYEYTVDVGSGLTNGSVLVSEDATDDEIRLAIINDLYEVSYKRQQSQRSKKNE